MKPIIIRIRDGEVHVECVPKGMRVQIINEDIPADKEKLPDHPESKP